MDFNASSTALALLPFTVVCRVARFPFLVKIWRPALSAAVLEICNPFAFVHSAIGPGGSTHAVPHTIKPTSLVRVACMSLKLAKVCQHKTWTFSILVLGYVRP
jgi:hypothetical protein